MLELLIRLHEMRCCCERVRCNPQLTNGEKAVACWHKQIVRECLPAVVLAHYDRMKKTERALLSCPEVFSMAVLVSTYRNLSPHEQGKLITHFVTPSPARSDAAQRNGTAKSSRKTARRCKAATGDAADKRWPR
jgi:hypothetical protein